MRPELEQHSGRVAMVWALAVAGLIAAFQSEAGRGPDSVNWLLFAASVAMAAAAGLYRWSETSSGGAPLLLPLLVANGGTALAIALFAFAVGAASGLRGALLGSIDPRRAFFAAGRAAVAALAWAFLQRAGFAAGLLASEVLAVLAFLAMGWLLDALTANDGTLARRWGSTLPALAVEGICLALGLLALRFDRNATLLLMGLAAVLFFAAARQGLRLTITERQRLAALATAETARKTDPGLGVLSRHELLRQIERGFVAAADSAQRLAVIALDPDGLDRRNSRFGLASGDRLLLSLADLARGEFGPECLLGRYQGATLAVLLPGADCATALARCETVRRRFEPSDFATAADAEGTVSCGIAAYPELPVRQGEELLLLAEHALRQAKRLGRNRCLADLGGGRFLDGFGKRVNTAEGEGRQPPRTPTFFA